MASNHWVICFFRQFVSDHLKSTTPWSFMAMRWLWSFSSLGLGLMMNEIHSNLGLAPQDEVCLEVFPPKKKFGSEQKPPHFFRSFFSYKPSIFCFTAEVGGSERPFLLCIFSQKSLRGLASASQKISHRFQNRHCDAQKRQKTHTPSSFKQRFLEKPWKSRLRPFKK